ncbi:MAG: family 43 glycosylhydrolase [Mycobacterium sp.]|nr:family 43 glycosylhydrolase [Mycobacterium sp.]
MIIRKLFRGLAGIGMALALTLAVTPSGAQAAVHYVQMSSASAADPGLSQFGSEYYVYTTGGTMDAYRGSTMTKGFAKVGSIYRSVPSGYSALWAPHVFKSGSYYFALFTAIKSPSTVHCVYWAVSTSPTGGFGAPHLVACGNGWEAIDPTFYSGGTGNWVVYKRGHYTSPGFPHGDFEIHAVKVAISGNSLSFGTNRILVKAYNTTCMEAPSLLWHNGKLWLFVSRSRYDTDAYYTEVWEAANLTSPFHQVKVLMKNGQGWGHGPGGAEVIDSGSTTYIAYHAWEADKPSPSTPGTRVTRFAKLSWSSSGPSMSSLG